MAAQSPLRFKILLQRLQLLGVDTLCRYPSTGDRILINENTKKITFPYRGRLHTIPDYRDEEIIPTKEIRKILQHLDVDVGAFWSVVDHAQPQEGSIPPAPQDN